MLLNSPAMADSRTAPRPRAMHVMALLLGLAAMVVQAIAPICLSGFSAQRGSGGFSIVLCTAHGFQSVTLDDNGKPAPAPKDGSDSLCPMCVAIHSAPLLAAAAALLVVFLLSWQTAGRFAVSTTPLLRRAYVAFITRGPPPIRVALT